MPIAIEGKQKCTLWLGQKMQKWKRGARAERQEDRETNTKMCQFVNASDKSIRSCLLSLFLTIGPSQILLISTYQLHL